jgi:hypothetical protein
MVQICTHGISCDCPSTVEFLLSPGKICKKFFFMLRIVYVKIKEEIRWGLYN